MWVPRIVIVLLLFIAVSTAPLTSATSNEPSSIPDALQNDKSIMPRIVNGQPAGEGQFPFFAQLGYESRAFCGASFLSSKFLVTAAHCLDPPYDVDLSNLRISYGSLENYKGEKIAVKRFVLHPLFDPETLIYDFALLELVSEADATIMEPVVLDTDGGHVGETSQTVGFGRTSDGGPVSDVLLYTNLIIYPDSDCYNMSLASEAASKLCAGAPGTDTCSGDSGGPCTADGTNLLLGLTSYGVSCADPSYPTAVYSRVSAAVKWIQNVMEKGIDDGKMHRCGECSFDEECGSGLLCFLDSCELENDPIGICGSFCCTQKNNCDCTLSTICIGEVGSQCTSSCDCALDFVCQNGVCAESSSSPQNASRCEACQVDNNCQGELGCYNGLCELSTDPFGICSTSCCSAKGKGCDCKDAQQCVQNQWLPCESDCECSGDLICFEGLCISPPTSDNSRCVQCFADENCAEGLVCNQDAGVCQLESDPSDICSSMCCQKTGCDCSNVTTCILEANSACESSCECSLNYQCIDGTCQMPLSELPRCSPCTEDDQCKSPLSCKNSYCALPEEAGSVCESICCFSCDCSDSSYCASGLNEACSNHCNCLGTALCTLGVCLNSAAELATRCNTCKLHSDCESKLRCIGERCLYPDEDQEVCGTKCCQMCGCLNTDNCLADTGEQCSGDCGCQSGFVCNAGLCEEPSTLTPKPTSTSSPGGSNDSTSTPVPTHSISPGSLESVSPTVSGSPGPDCYPADGEVVAVNGMRLLIRDLQPGDLVFDGRDHTRVVLIVDMEKGTDSMMYISGNPVATRNHAKASNLDAREYTVGSHDHVYLLFTTSRYIAVNGVRVSNYISTYPIWLQEAGIQMVEKSSVIRCLVSKYRPSWWYHLALVWLGSMTSRLAW